MGGTLHTASVFQTVVLNWPGQLYDRATALKLLSLGVVDSVRHRLCLLSVDGHLNILSNVLGAFDVNHQRARGLCGFGGFSRQACFEAGEAQQLLLVQRAQHHPRAKRVEALCVGDDAMLSILLIVVAIAQGAVHASRVDQDMQRAYPVMCMMQIIWCGAMHGHAWPHATVRE